MKDFQESEELGRIEKRTIEALAIAPVITAVAKRIGWDDALAILMNVNQDEAFQRGRSMAENTGQNGIEQLVEEVGGWGRGGTWKMDVLEQTPTTFFFDVTHCPYYERYRELGLEELGVGLSCCRDEPWARGFNPRLRLERRKTIMEGADCCDFRYYLGNPDDSD